MTFADTIADGWAGLVDSLNSPTGQAVIRMILSLLAGGAVGLEREYHGRAAGFRTHMLVCLGCCLVMLVSTSFAEQYGHLGGNSSVQVDPARLAYGVVAGIGFLGAGVILKEGGTVHGLTTAASLWSVAALGLALGVGLYRIAGAGTALTVVTLVGMRWIGRVVPGHGYGVVRVTQAGAPTPDVLARSIRETGVVVERVALDDACATGQSTVTFSIRFRGDVPAQRLYTQIRQTGDYLRIEIR